MKTHKVPGLSIVLIENGEIASHKVYGVKDSKSSQPINDDTVFEVASLSKPVFAYGVLKLVEKGQLNLDTPLADDLTYADVKNDPRLNLITARMVLSHTTGFPNWRPKNKDLKIYFMPGERFNYSGEGFVYLQRVVEHLSGLPIEEYMKKIVFDPLEMTHSSYVWQKEYEPLKASGHDAEGTPLIMYKPTSANMAFTLHTTGLDYAKFVIAIMKNVGLKPETLHQMLTPQIRVGAGGPCSIEEHSKDLSPSISWGLGWGLQETTEGRIFWHWGDNGGFKSYVAGSQNGKGIIIFTNSDNGLNMVPEIILKTTGFSHPALKWLNMKAMMLNTKIEKDLQKQNFLEILRIMQSVPGWGILEDMKLLALKAPGPIPLVNYVWGEVTVESLQKVLSFYASQPFYWFLTPEQKEEYGPLLIRNSLKGPESFPPPEYFPEMTLKLGKYNPVILPSDIQVKKVDTPQLFRQWLPTAAEGLGFDSQGIEEFVVPLIKEAGLISFLGFYKGEPAATSMVYCDPKTDTAGVYFLSTRPDFRRKGLGSAVTEACLQTAKHAGITHAVLYASAMGQSMYKKLGFRTSQMLYEYFYENCNSENILE